MSHHLNDLEITSGESRTKSQRLSLQGCLRHRCLWFAIISNLVPVKMDVCQVDQTWILIFYITIIVCCQFGQNGDFQLDQTLIFFLELIRTHLYCQKHRHPCKHLTQSLRLSWQVKNSSTPIVNFFTVQSQYITILIIIEHQSMHVWEICSLPCERKVVFHPNLSSTTLKAT